MQGGFYGEDPFAYLITPSCTPDDLKPVLGRLSLQTSFYPFFCCGTFYVSFTGGGRIKHVRVLLGVPTLQILRFKKKKKFEKANKARTCFIRLFELFGKFFQSQFFFDFFFAQEVILLHFRANPGLWWGIYGKMDKISAT